MMRRLVMFPIVIAIAIWSDIAYDRFHVPGRSYPRETLITDTWYGPLVFLLIPLSLGWAALAAKRRWARVLGLCVSGLLLLIFLIWIAAIRETFVSVH
jgi:hypothetical protein